MNLKELRAQGAFISGAPVVKSVTWNDTTFDVHIKRLSFGDYERLFTDDPEERSRSARLLSDCVLLGDGGKDALSYKDAYRLEPSLARVLIDAVNEVNGPKP